MLKTAGRAETAKGQIVCGFALGVVADVGNGAGVEHEAANAVFGQDFCRHAAGVAGADDQNVVGFVWHCQFSVVRSHFVVLVRGRLVCCSIRPVPCSLVYRG